LASEKLRSPHEKSCGLLLLCLPTDWRVGPSGVGVGRAPQPQPEGEPTRADLACRVAAERLNQLEPGTNQDTKNEGNELPFVFVIWRPTGGRVAGGGRDGRGRPREGGVQCVFTFDFCAAAAGFQESG